MPQMNGILFAVGGAGTLLILLLLFLLRTMKEKRRRREARTASYSPDDTFCGTLHHISGLPVPKDMSLGTAVNRGYGIAFAKKGFRFVIEKDRIRSAEIWAEKKRDRFSLFPQKTMLEICIEENEKMKELVFSSRSAAFPEKLRQAIFESYTPDRRAAGSIK